MKKIVIAIISFNQGNFVEDCLQSAISQTYKKLEIILVDNNSSDQQSLIKIREISKKYSIKLLERNDNSLTKCLNHLLKIYSEYDYINFIAADDILINNKIEIQSKELTSLDEEVAASFGNAIKISEEGYLIGTNKIVGNRVLGFEEVFTSRVDLYAPTALYKVKALASVGGFNEEHKIEDLSIYLKLTSSGFKLASSQYPLVMYRIHSNNTHTKYKWMMEEKLKIWTSYKDHPLYEKGVSNIYLEHFSNFGSTKKIECIKLLPKIYKNILSKYFWFGLIRLFLDHRSSQ